MSCPKCGTTVVTQKVFVLFFYLAILAAIFGFALFIFPYELFYIFAIGILIALNYVEKQFTLLDRKAQQCPHCGYMGHLIHHH